MSAVSHNMAVRPPGRNETMNIGDAATESGLPVKTIRYYEDIGLITPQRTPNGYRSFEVDDLHRLTFLARARSLGFSIEQCV